MPPLFSDLTSRLWRNLTSIRLTVILLLVLALVATVGTVVPQGEPVARYLARFGPGMGGFLVRIGLHHIYRSPWFLLPVALLTLNLLACLFRGLPQALRRVARPLTWETAQSLPERGRFSLPPGSDPTPRVLKALRREVGRPRVASPNPNRIVFLVERGRFRPLGPYIIHLSLLLILVGGLVSLFCSVEGRLLLLEGESARSFVLSDRSERPLGFEVRLDDFTVRFYEQGIPAEFRSDLTFFQNGREVAKAACRVNYPVTFGGLTFYQSSYGTRLDGPLTLKVCQGQDCHVLKAPLRQVLTLPDGKAQLIPVRVASNLHGLGPAVQVAVKSGPGHPKVFWVSRNHPELADRAGTPFYQPGPRRVLLEDLPFKFYSVFQVRRDPGVWWVYSGFLLSLPGLCLAFLLPPQRWAVVLTQKPDGRWEGRLLGASPRARETFTAKTNRLLARLKQKL
ncbi:MAG: cytochrome c biogenesis protein ResB [Deltaproteobacteria bacterium]|nr:cytochrome c biogenesis protein ResB [Deltaproteobacteria bacterium]